MRKKKLQSGIQMKINLFLIGIQKVKLSYRIINFLCFYTYSDWVCCWVISQKYLICSFLFSMALSLWETGDQK